MYNTVISYFDMTNALDPNYINRPIDERIAKAQSTLDKAVASDIVEFDIGLAVFIIADYYRVDRNFNTTDNK